MTKNDENALLSIGGLARASGVPVETLRNWERRYGFPEPVRRDSGHRRYPIDIVSKLRLINHALDLGYKPSFAVPAKEIDLRSIIEDAARKGAAFLETVKEDDVDRELSRWNGYVESLDAKGFEVELRRAWLHHGAYFFITKMMVPFLREVGHRWFEKRISVAHEHFASEITMSFLAQQWRPLSQRAGRQRAVLANFEGELHCLGLHMAAVFLTLYQIEVIFLGPNTPRQDIAMAARESNVIAVVIGMAASSPIAPTAAQLSALKSEVSSKVVVAFGGNDALPPIDGVIWIDTFENFYEWAKSLAEG